MLQSQWIRRGVKENLPQQNKSLDGYECSTVHITEQEGGWGERGTSASTVLDFGILDLAVAGGKVWSKGGRARGCLCHAGGVEDEEVPGQGLRL